jgi:hypothetical protein
LPEARVVARKPPRLPLRSAGEETVMALVMVVVGAGGLVCWLVALLLLPRRSARSSPNAVVTPRNPSRDEDRVRPAVAASGERIWIEPGDVVWHEIVAWPQPRTITGNADEARRPA